MSNAFIDLNDWLAQRAAGSKKSTSILLSFIGDVVVPHGGSIGLGSLVHVGELLGITEQTIRSAANRLAVDGWLEAETHGRRSFFTLTPFADVRFRLSTNRIYYHAETEWDGEWHIIMVDTDGLDSSEIDSINRDFGWTGFGRAAPGVFARPNIGNVSVYGTIKINPAAEKAALCFSAKRPPSDSIESLKTFIKRMWDLDSVESRYRAFIKQYDPVLGAVWGASQIEGALALAIRTFMNHDFRRIRLVDPQLPLELQSENWIGHRALYIAHEIYDLLLAPSEAYIMEHLEGPNGRLPQLEADFYERFGGLSS